MNEKPVLGAKLSATEIPNYVDWLLEKQRDLEIGGLNSPAVMDGDWRAACQNIRSILDGYSGRLGFHGPWVNLNIAAIEQFMIDAVRERMQRGLDIAAELQVTHMVIHSPFAFLGSPGTPTSVTEAIDRTLYTLAPVVQRAEQIGCTLVVENTHDKHPRYLTALVQAFNSPALRQSLDVGHAQITWALGGEPPDAYIYEAGDMLEHIHLQDTDGYADRHWAIGDGSIRWFSVFDAIRKQGIRPRLILELRDNSTLMRSAQWLSDRGLTQ